MSTAITPPPTRYTESADDRGRPRSCSTASTRTPSISSPTMTARSEEPVVLPAGVPESARERLDRHRRRHGDLDPAAQSRRAVPGADRADREPEDPGPHAVQVSSRARTFRPAASSSMNRPPSHEAYRTGRGSFRVRAQWKKEEGARGTYQIVVDEIPYQVQKAKLIERIAQLLDEKKLGFLDDVQDEFDRRHPHRAHAQEPHGRSRDPDGAALPPDRSRNARAVEPERARQGSSRPR